MSSRHDPLVREVMLDPGRIPVVGERTFFKETLEEMTRLHLGIACVVDEHGRLRGIVTDGDLRRKLLTVQKPFSAFFVDDVMEHAVVDPLTIGPDMRVSEAVELMGRRHVWDLPVVEADKTLVGLLHLHPAIEAVMKGGAE